MICPRCDNLQASKIFEAPDNAEWEIYRCPRCFFTWRSTEDEEITTPEKYDPCFKLTDEIIGKMDNKPPIPPLKQSF